MLCGKGLTALPGEAWAVAASLTRLDLSSNPLAPDALPAQHLACMDRLRMLSLNNCGLECWPLAGLPAGSLDALHTLEMRANPLGSPLPADALNACPALRALDVSGVRGLRFAPGCLAGAPSLERLAACSAGLQEMPAELLRATALRELHLRGNGLMAVPDGVTVLARLTQLDVAGNDLRGLPLVLGLLTGLRALHLEGNGLRTIRRPILESGTPALLEWLRGRIPA